MIDRATLPPTDECGACRASVAVSWHPEPTPQGGYVGWGSCGRCGAHLVVVASPNRAARHAVLGPLAALLV